MEHPTTVRGPLGRAENPPMRPGVPSGDAALRPAQQTCREDYVPVFASLTLFFLWTCEVIIPD